MNRKSALQALMVFLIILISLLFYLKYFNKNSIDLIKNVEGEKVNININSSSNYIDEINYTSSDAKGNQYQITAEQAEIDIDNPDVMFLENVVAYVFLKDSDIVKITSDFGKYNSKNSDTIFSKNVIVIYTDHEITGEYLDYSFVNNIGTISIDVVYVGNKTILHADRVEMNITTKDTKIFMNDSRKKVLIEGTK